MSRARIAGVRPVAVGLADLRVVAELPDAVRCVAPGVPERAAGDGPADLALAVRVADALEGPGATPARRDGRALCVERTAASVRVKDLAGGRVRRVLCLEGEARATVRLSREAVRDGLAPLAPPFDALLLAAQLAREGALLLRAAAVVRRGAALAFTLRTRGAREAVAALLARPQAGVLARGHLVVRLGARGPRALDGTLRDVAVPAPDAPLAAVHLLHPAAQLVAEPRCGTRAADALVAAAVLPPDPAGCAAVHDAAHHLADAVAVVRLGCPAGAGLARFAGRDAPAAAA